MPEPARASGDRPRFAFEPLAPRDLPRLEGWLQAPHVRCWFGDPAEWLGEIRANLGAGWIAYARADLDGRPAGFAQAYLVERAPPGPWSTQPPGTRGIDFLLGDVRDLGRGLGSALVMQWLAWCEAQLGARRFVSDPDLDNEPSRRALRAAGFVEDLDSGLFVRAGG